MKLQDLVEERKVVNGPVRIPHETTSLINYEGYIVTGDFDCSHSAITSLEGGPKHVGGDFTCANTTIRSLKGAPSIIEGRFSCAHTLITSLEGGPRHVDGDFSCSGTQTSLKGAPDYIGGTFFCHNTRVPDLHNIHKEIKYIGSTFYLPITVKSKILSVMYIKGLQEIDFVSHSPNVRFQVAEIVNRHLAGDRDIHACQEELLEAGLGDYAKL